MVIEREDMDRRKIGFPGRGVRGVACRRLHPGEVLRKEFLTPMELSVSRLAREIKVSRPRLNDIVLGRRAVTTDNRVALGALFRDDTGVLDQSPDTSRSGRRRAHDAPARSSGRSRHALRDVSVAEGKPPCIVGRLAERKVGTTSADGRGRQPEVLRRGKA